MDRQERSRGQVVCGFLLTLAAGLLAAAPLPAAAQQLVSAAQLRRTLSGTPSLGSFIQHENRLVQSGQLMRGGATSYTRAAGGRRVVLALHGYKASPKQWENVARAFVGQGADVVALRHAGHAHTTGASNLPGSKDSARYRDRVEKGFLMALKQARSDYGASAKVTLAGISMGGAASLWLLRKYAPYIDNVILFAPAVKPHGKIRQTLTGTVSVANRVTGGWFGKVVLGGAHKVAGLFRKPKAASTVGYPNYPKGTLDSAQGVHEGFMRHLSGLGTLPRAVLPKIHMMTTALDQTVSNDAAQKLVGEKLGAQVNMRFARKANVPHHTIHWSDTKSAQARDAILTFARLPVGGGAQDRRRLAQYVTEGLLIDKK